MIERIRVTPPSLSAPVATIDLLMVGDHAEELHARMRRAL